MEANIDSNYSQLHNLFEYMSFEIYARLNEDTLRYCMHSRRIEHHQSERQLQNVRYSTIQ